MTLLSGRVVAVTGAGRGLGAAYAIDAAANGASVVVSDLDGELAEATARMIRERGGDAVGAAGAVDEPGSGDRLVDTAMNAFGRLDGVIANAGVIAPRSVFEETRDSAAHMIDVNITGVIETVIPVVRAMRDSGRGGSVVLITSGARSGIAGMAVYGATKAAVASLCWGWALECAPYDIRVNALSPVAKTAMFPQPGDTLSKPAAPEQVAPAATYLLSPLSQRITGQIVRFTGETLALSPSPALLSAHLDGQEWTVEKIAEAIEGPLRPGLAEVGAAEDLPVPLTI
ncbi:MULTISPECIES: SDR family NAD(P)-dependent oxidoreductase [Microbacterium]|uniref:NAD(P)-dependent dehydrogenase, short-chain alcohol dehydrogenase family n=1 Tax=Microbacterium saccharophilum TaxID=1213358 RepID=A0A7Z7D286_9MICO|nr:MULTISPECIES: SDR family oxidoreductase [Microbacterium]SFI60930.1 NAD(P)-dependent dehydrogenase, short-chain alcohol dehydrogenase family [Microbacterium saccharophilum]